MTRSNACKLAKRNVTVNAVAPGFIATYMTDALPEYNHQELAAQIHLEHLGSPDDIANTVLFLASENAGYITGQVIEVNGGMYM
ncbi:SDR family oxidoreductase [Syntrophotalea acetylenivorans]|uniref:SDR family oxidoreductase n=1 Tax=Syntrophotalea acetylenivorans TaxID=1842532 RepID=UPI00210F5F70|nr:SDR family oxidoreductase [Syntrophotalea acetylenivorans]